MKPVQVAVAVALVVGLTPALSGCTKAAKSTQAQAPRGVRVARVQVRDLNAALTVSGVLTSREEAAVTSELNGYRVAEVYVDQGAWVRRGQPLLRLDDGLLRGQIDQQTALVAQQKVAAERAQSEAARVADLDNKGVLSQEDIDSRRFQARSAAAAAAAAEAQLRDSRTRQERMILRAPVSGLVLARNVRPGDLSNGGGTGPLFRIARDGQVEVDAEVGEADLNRIKPGQRVHVTLPDQTQVDGWVRLISPEVDPQTKLGRVRVSLPERRELRPGGYAQARFGDMSSSGLVAPDKAVNFDADGASVVVVDGSNRVRRTAVKTGARANGYVQLLQGPPAGSRVLVTGATFVVDGDKVQPVEDSPTAGSGS